VERTLGLMAGAGVLPGRVGAEAARQGWRVVVFAFDEAPAPAPWARRVIPCQLDRIGDALGALQAERAGAVVFAGRFLKERLFRASSPDATLRRLFAAAGGLSDRGLTAAVVEALAGLGIEVLDPRTFLAPCLAPAGTLTARSPTHAEMEDIRLGLGLARRCAEYDVGQTVVVARGVAVAVEALEGTSEAIRRGCQLAGPGAVVVKAVAPQHDYRLDVPAVGLETLEIMARGGARALAVEAMKIAIVDRERVVALADGAGISIVSVERDR